MVGTVPEDQDHDLHGGRCLKMEGAEALQPFPAPTKKERISPEKLPALVFRLWSLFISVTVLLPTEMQSVMA